MKKINSNGYGGKVISIGVATSFLVSPMVKNLPFKEIDNLLNLISKALFMVGVLVLILFAIWLIIEFCQDKYWNDYYEKHKDRLLILKSGLYECQSCGNRQVKPHGKSCNVCGIHFK